MPHPLRNRMLLLLYTALMNIPNLLGSQFPSEQHYASATQGTEAIGFEQFTKSYLGRSAPLGEPEVFLPGLVSTVADERSTVFLDAGRVLVFTTDDGGTRYTWLEDGRWKAALPFPYNYREDMIDFTAGPDDQSLILMTSRPLDEADPGSTHHLWRVKWSRDGWGAPQPMPSPEKREGMGSGYPTLAVDGTLYFISGPRDGTSRGGIFRSRLIGNSYLKPELVEPPVNSDHSDFDPYVAPDGSYLIFSSDRPGGYGSWDNYVVFRKKGGGWSEAINLGEGFNTEHAEFCPGATADGKLFFFVSGRPATFLTDDNGENLASGRDVYWVDAGLIQSLRSQAGLQVNN